MTNAPKENPFFHLLVLSFSNAALMALGLMPDPATGIRAADLDMAGHNIDLLSMLEEKTKGNLTGEEAHLLEGLLYDLRLKYVDARRSP